MFRRFMPDYYEAYAQRARAALDAAAKRAAAEDAAERAAAAPHDAALSRAADDAAAAAHDASSAALGDHAAAGAANSGGATAGGDGAGASTGVFPASLMHVQAADFVFLVPQSASEPERTFVLDAARSEMWSEARRRRRRVFL